MKIINFNDYTIIHINTKDTSYIFKVNKFGDVENLHYGKFINYTDDYSAFIERKSLLLVSTLYDERDISYGVDAVRVEYSSALRGDNRDVAFKGQIKNTNIFSFKYVGIEQNATPNNDNIANSYGYNESLKIVLKDERYDVYLNLWYLVYSDSNVISRFAEIENKTNDNITINKIASMQLDLKDENYKILSFNGAWSRERYKNERNLVNGKITIESNSNNSSARHNPFIILSNENANNASGDCFAVNMLYSGGHSESVELTPYGDVRILAGINENCFSWTVEPNCHFTAPECILSYSADGYNKLSNNMANFVKNNILRGVWKNQVKPVLLNSWEAMYFDINQTKILDLADKAVEVGAELLVVDDGWFGHRDDDTTSLGDWFPNKKKFPTGIKGLVDKVHQKGLKFGLWFEPEMTNEDSEFFKNHRDWVWKIDEIANIIGRGQYVIDLSNLDCQDYIINQVSSILNDNGIDYVKWDYNRQVSDVVSNTYNCGELLHRYVLGLYRVQAEIVKSCPNVLFEFCASGGNRFDLGMMCFSNVGWVSDNTDVLSRSYIQESTSYAYPQCVMSNHISAVPNHQTKRVTRLVDRYNVASFGTMGLQYNLLQLSDSELQEIKSYITDYKNHREMLQFGDFYRLNDTYKSNNWQWLIVAKDKSSARLLVGQKLFMPNNPIVKVKLCGLDNNKTYVITNESINYKIKASGEVLNNYGLMLPQNYQGNEMNDNARYMLDFSTICFDISEVK